MQWVSIFWPEGVSAESLCKNVLWCYSNELYNFFIYLSLVYVSYIIVYCGLGINSLAKLNKLLQLFYFVNVPTGFSFIPWFDFVYDLEFASFPFQIYPIVAFVNSISYRNPGRIHILS